MPPSCARRAMSSMGLTGNIPLLGSRDPLAGEQVNRGDIGVATAIAETGHSGRLATVFRGVDTNSNCVYYQFVVLSQNGNATSLEGNLAQARTETGVPATAKEDATHAPDRHSCRGADVGASSACDVA